MFFILSKLFSFLFSPLSWVLIFLLAGLFVKRTDLKRRLLITGIAMLIFFSNPLIRQLAFGVWEPPFTKEENLKTFEVAVILGGAMRYYNSETDRPVYGPSVERLMQVVNLYFKGKVRKILISGGSGLLTLQEPKEAPVLMKEMVNMGVKPEDILLESKSRNTYENAVFTSSMLREMNFKGELLLITSAYHMPRSLACFHKAGINAVPFPVDSYAGRITWTPGRLIIPDSENLTNWDMLIHEWVGCMVYKIRGYL